MVTTESLFENEVLAILLVVVLVLGFFWGAEDEDDDENEEDAVMARFSDSLLIPLPSAFTVLRSASILPALR
jgi:hypothetical protein